MTLAERRSTDALNGPRRNAATSASLSRYARHRQTGDHTRQSRLVFHNRRSDSLKRSILWAVGLAVDPRGGQRQADVSNRI